MRRRTVLFMPGFRLALPDALADDLRPGGYTRLSRDPDGTETATKRQARDIAAFCREQGWPQPELYRDSDLSGWADRTAREDYDRLLADVRDRRRNVLVVAKYPRLTRNADHGDQLVATCKAAGAIVVAVAGPHPDWRKPRQAWNVVRRAILDAEAESNEISDRVMRKHIELAEDGAWNGGGVRPYGYRKVTTLVDGKAHTQLVVDPKEAAVVRWAAERVLDNGDSLTAVTRALNERGAATVQGGGWTNRTLKGVLTSARISGRREHRGTITATAQWEPIVSAQASDRLRALLTDPSRRTVRVAGVRARKYLLTGFLICGREGCGHRMGSRPSNTRGGRYVCSGPAGGCERNSIAGPPLDDLIRDAVLLRLTAPAVGEALRARGSADAPRAGLYAALDSISARLRQLGRDLATDTLPREVVLTASADLEAERARVQAELDRLNEVSPLDGLPVGDGEALRAEWERRGIDGRRAILATILDHVVVAPGSKKVNRFDASRVMPPHGPRWHDRTVEP